MKIEKLEIRNFGKMQNRTLEFSDGIQLISGENESGKSTVHTFIRSMLFGMTRGRGRAAKNDVYSRYEPWENPAYYAGEMVLESGGKRFRLTRNFGRQNANAKLVCLTDGEVLSVEDGDLSMLLGGVSEIVYDNTASIGQLKGRTEEGLAVHSCIHDNRKNPPRLQWKNGILHKNIHPLRYFCLHHSGKYRQRKCPAL